MQEQPMIKAYSELPMIRLEIRDLLCKWVETEFPHLETFIPMSNTHFFVIKKRRKGGNQGPIVAIVLDVNREMFEDMLGGLMKHGIWTLDPVTYRWNNHINVTVENPDFFEVLKRTIKQEDLNW
jgi:hypothetical protein